MVFLLDENLRTMRNYGLHKWDDPPATAGEGLVVFGCPQKGHGPHASRPQWHRDFTDAHNLEYLEITVLCKWRFEIVHYVF